MLKQSIEKLIVRKDLTQEESSLCVHEICSDANFAQSAAFLALMRAKGETVEELYGSVDAMRSLMVRVSVSYPVLDIVGTGGDGMHTLNISTASAILAASCGVKVAKHGSRSSSSMTGSADVLEALGVNIDQTPEGVQSQIEKLGIAFMYAPNYHPAMKQLKQLRKDLSTRTFFNILGPLLNPANAQHLMLGVFSENLLETVAALLSQLGTKRSLVFHGSGLDEISCLGPSRVIEVAKGEMRSFILDPQDYGLKLCEKEELQGKDAQYNAKKMIEAFEGVESGFADTIVLNAGIACYLYGIAESYQEGIDLAKTALKEKRALHLLNQWIAYV